MSSATKPAWLRTLPHLDRAQAEIWLRSPGGEARLRRIAAAIGKRTVGAPKDDKSESFDKVVALWLSTTGLSFGAAAWQVGLEAGYTKDSFLTRMHENKHPLTEDGWLVLVDRLIRTGQIALEGVRDDVAKVRALPVCVKDRIRYRKIGLTTLRRLQQQQQELDRRTEEVLGLKEISRQRKIISDFGSRLIETPQEKRFSAFLAAFDDVLPDELYVHRAADMFRQVQALLIEAMREEQTTKIIE